MSLTTLGKQLAGLNEPRKDPGSALSRSRQHEDSIGRGLSHSVQLGHFDAKKSKIFKASIMHEDADKAAYVPLVTLKENCMSSLRSLTLIDGRFGEYAKFLRIKSKERIQMTQSENDELDQILDGLLHRLMLRISDNTTDSKNCRSSAFHVIEYLLRRYDIHLHLPLAETLLRLTVPLHEDPIFLRIVQLVDLSLLPTWSFLRPYAVPGASVAREVISKQASLDTALLSNLCFLAKCSADLPCNTHYLSFIATVISECAAFQVANLGDLTERTCHMLLQQTLGACRQSKISTLQNWGHVIASIIIEATSLAESSRDILVNNILSGVTGCKVSTQINGLILAFSAISQRWKHLGNPLQDMRFFLTDEHGMKNDTFDEFLGFNNLSSQLGNLYCDGGSDNVSRWIACILVVGLRLLQENATTKAKEVQILILDLIRERRLRSLWRSSPNRYLESFAAIFVEIVAGDDAKQDDNFVQTVFRLLNSIDSSALENGIASTLFRINGQKRKRILRRIPHKQQYENQTGTTNQSLVSPLLALNHINDQGGVGLIRKISGGYKKNESSIHQSRMKAKALLDLLNHNANNTLAIEAGKVLVDFLRSHKDCGTIKEIGEAALQAAYKWFNRQQGTSFQRISVLQQVFLVLEYICSRLLTGESAHHLFGRIVECLGAFTSSSNESVSQQSSVTLRSILGARETGPELQNIDALILSDQTILYIFRRHVSVGQGLERCVRRRCVKSLLQGFVEILSGCENEEKRQLYATEMIEYCIWLAATFVDELQPSETTMLRSSILSLGQHCAPSYQQMRQLATELASNEQTCFQTNLSPVIQSVCASLFRGSEVPGLLILMDMAVFSSLKANDAAVKNILLMATMHIRRGDVTVEDIHYAVATALCFLANANIEIRHEAVDILKNCGNFLSTTADKKRTCLVEVCILIEENKSNVSIGGENLLALCLTRAMSESKQKGQLRESILGLCAKVAGAHDPTSDLSENENFAAGRYFVAATLLTASEFAGEEFFPLVKRWEFAGSPIMKYIQSHLLQVEQIPPSLESLVQATVRMLRGLKVVDVAVNAGPKATCPANSWRKDSNSSREWDAERFLNPYLKDMENAILSILKNDGKSEMTRLLRECLVGMVVGNQSWTSQVFASQSSLFREKITREILSGVVTVVDGIDQDTLMNLPLNASEVARMIESGQLSEVEISYLSEYIVVNNTRLNRESPDNRLISALFCNLVASFSTVGTISSAESTHSCDAILSAVLGLVKSSSATQLCAETTEAEAETWGAILLDILERNGSSQEGFQSLQVHKTCIAVLENLCPLFPSVVAKKLIPAINATICESIGSNSSGFLIDCLEMMLPQFLKFAASVGVFPVNLFQAFILQSMRSVDRKQRISLYQGFVKALSRIAVTGLHQRLPGAFVSSCLSMELQFEKNGTSPTISTPLRNMASMILDDSHITIKASSTLEMLAYAKEIISKRIQGKETIKIETVVKVEELILLSIHGGIETSATDDLIAHPKSLLVCNLLLLSVWNNTRATSFQKFLQNIGSSGSKDLLPFWQDLILVQTACRNFLINSTKGENKAIWDTLLGTTDAILGNLHAFIPVHIFLAFAASVIENGETEELRSIAVRSIADRAILIDPMDAEATLFREILPFLSGMVSSGSSGSRSILQQSVLIAIEVVARKLCIGSDFQVNSTLSDQLVTVTFKAAGLIEAELSNAGSNFTKITPPSRETICIASLCTSTCIRICGPRALKALSILAKAHTATLCVSNDLLGDEGIQQGTKNEARLMQVSAIHSIIAIVEALPQFLAPYLKDMLAPLALPSKALREQNETMELVHKLDATLVSNIPARVLIPSVLESINSNHFHATSLHAMVSLLTSAVSTSSRQNVVCHATGLLQAVTSTLEYSVHSKRQQSLLLHAASDLFLGFVLKLSEFQLRSLYLKLREWKGDLDYANLDESSSRRAAFWSISAALATNLRTIYLPCLSMVSADLIKELEFAAIILSGRSHVPGASETKRQRLGERNQSMLSPFNTKPVENSLRCLKVSLRSDAHDGGRWIREGEAHHFERLLNPLCKLLQSACPPEAPSTTTYERLVQGADPECSSVVACIVSLALAAGEERLWKPLNHHVLRAASSQTRVEVRKAGVQCLASLIRTIGEEYMIFIPECLPVLSELLEDADQSIASLAQDCVALSEEFLGENLQHNL